ncbi:MBL fold metallo-hydrolase [Rhodocaloribacter litoris]|uniref:MBL fold metallo-hydrolase n=1 Tax=Rhodocaloribacter litoris TaxID=2558931 RepID=UPI0014246A3F|nr:MBL fold metallo-hydrolase [Rhodocaloribacter litoris]QXD16628.1 MBL fold metallo-hydrolase [Rhodocaloribacter litoris]
MADAPPLKVTLLGTGTSTGVPVIGCDCRVCRSDDPRDHRTRCACLVTCGDLHLVIDTGPDFRRQALREGFRRVDAVLFTHHHFDHVVGLDDLRPFFFDNRAPIPCFARPNTADVLRSMFRYIFCDGSYPGVPKLHLRAVEGPFEVASRYGTGRSVHVEPVEVFHGALPLYGYRIGRFAYLTDTSRIPDESLARLHGLDVLVLDALRYEPHPTHFTIDEAVAVARHLGARQTYLIHMTHSILHAEVDARLPKGVNLGYDGLSFDVAGGPMS